jgi:hypothetical protein
VTIRGSCQVTKGIYTVLIGGKIRTIRSYRDGREDRYGSFQGLVLSRLVAPLLPLGVVGQYPVRGTWFPSHLPLQGTGHI